jgi:hypothetical protein
LELFAPDVLKGFDMLLDDALRHAWPGHKGGD